MKINRRDFMAAASSTAAVAAVVPAALAQTKQPVRKPISRDGKQVVVYTTAEKTDHRLSKTDTLKFKHHGQPLETQVCVFVDPSKIYQTFLGIGGALTDASAETFAKVPADK